MFFRAPSDKECVDSITSLVYVSSARRLLSDIELMDIVEKSRTANQTRNITGVLFHKEGSFMQALEGPEGEVLSLMERIKADPRHTGTLVLLTRKIEKRDFPDWSMGFPDLNTLSPKEKQMFEPYLSAALASDLAGNYVPATLKLLRFFKESMR